MGPVAGAKSGTVTLSEAKNLIPPQDHRTCGIAPTIEPVIARDATLSMTYYCHSDPGYWIIAQYHRKNRIEDDFKPLKDPEPIRWRPCRHWSGAKTRAYGFCCVMALLLLRVMHRKAANTGIHMSPALIKQELDDLREIAIVYDPTLPMS